MECKWRQPHEQSSGLVLGLSSSARRHERSPVDRFVPSDVRCNVPAKVRRGTRRARNSLQLICGLFQKYIAQKSLPGGPVRCRMRPVWCPARTICPRSDRRLHEAHAYLRRLRRSARKVPRKARLKVHGKADAWETEVLHLGPKVYGEGKEAEVQGQADCTKSPPHQRFQRIRKPSPHGSAACRHAFTGGLRGS